MSDNQAPDAAKNTEQTQPSTIPYERFSQVVSEKNELRQRLDSFEKAERERKEAEALSRGEHQRVIDELKPKAQRAEALETELQEIVRAEIEAIPEQYRDLVPDGDAAARLKWIRAAHKKGLFTPRQAPSLDAGQGGEQAITLTADELALAQAMGIKPEAMIAQKQKQQQQRK